MSEEQQSVRCQMIPLLQGQVILPSTAIAEVVNYSEVNALEHVPEWLLGEIAWRGHTIPLLSLDAMDGHVPNTDEILDARIVVLNCDPELAGQNYIGFLAHGLPTLLQLQRGNTRYIENPESASRMAHCYVEVEHNHQYEAAYLLDLPTLFEQYLNLS